MYCDRAGIPEQARRLSLETDSKGTHLALLVRPHRAAGALEHTIAVRGQFPESLLGRHHARASARHVGRGVVRAHHGRVVERPVVPHPGGRVVEGHAEGCGAAGPCRPG